MPHLASLLHLNFLVISLVVLTDCRKDSVRPAACQLTPDPGFCNAAFRKYYYDPQEKQCKEFIWGGCGGTVPFNTLQSVRRARAASN